jgi:general secretion pathway protein K
MNQRGIALIIVLWGVTLLALLAAGLASTSGLAVRRMGHAIEAAEAHAALEKAAAAAELALTDADAAKAWRPDGTRHRLSFDFGEADVIASSEAGKIDLNHSPPVLLKGLFDQAASSDEEGARLFSAFSALTMPGMGGRVLLAVSELAALPGITAPVYRRLAAATTVHNETGRFDWRLANDATLSAIPGITDQARAALLAGKGRKDYTPDLATAQAFAAAGVTEGSDSLAQGTPLFVTLEISVRLPSAAAASGEVLVRLAPREQRPVVVLEWHEPQWQEEDR